MGGEPADWQEEIWADPVAAAIAETGIEDLPHPCPWTVAEVLDPDWLPVSL